MTHNAQTIVDLLLNETQRLDIKIMLGLAVKAMNLSEIGFVLETNNRNRSFDKVIIATGGSPKMDDFKWLQDLGISLGCKSIKNELNYQFTVQINWTNLKEIEFRTRLVQHQSCKKLLKNLSPIDIPQRFWEYLLSKSGLSLKKPWNELGKKGLNKMVNILTND